MNCSSSYKIPRGFSPAHGLSPRLRMASHLKLKADEKRERGNNKKK